MLVPAQQGEHLLTWEVMCWLPLVYKMVRKLSHTGVVGTGVGFDVGACTAWRAFYDMGSVVLLVFGRRDGDKVEPYRRGFACWLRSGL